MDNDGTGTTKKRKSVTMRDNPATDNADDDDDGSSDIITATTKDKKKQQQPKSAAASTTALRRSLTPRASHVKESVLAYFRPGSEALELLASVLRPNGPNTTSIRTILWFVTNYAAHHHVSYTLSQHKPQQTPPSTEGDDAEKKAEKMAAKAVVVVEGQPQNEEQKKHEENVRLLKRASTSSSKREPLPLQPSGSAKASIPIGRGAVHPPFVVATQFQNARDAIGDKMLFDPNCRVSYNLDIPDGAGGVLHTSLAQLSFFKWAIQKEVIQYVIKHRAAIALDQSAREKRSGGAAKNNRGEGGTVAAAAANGGGGGAARRGRKQASKAHGGPMRVLLSVA